MAQLPSHDAALSATTPAFVQAPTFVFMPSAPLPSRSEVLREQIAAARAARGSSAW
jgi:hypothetical protein